MVSVTKLMSGCRIASSTTRSYHPFTAISSFSGSTALLAEDQEVQKEEARARGDEHRGELRNISGQLRGESRIESQEQVGDDPEHTAGDRGVQHPLQGEQAHLLRVVTGVSPEGPQGVPQVAVHVRKGQRQQVEEHEKLRFARGIEEEQEVDGSQVDHGV